MKSKLAVVAAVIGCCISIGALPSGQSALPMLCEKSCGGSWGAEEHAKNIAEKHGWINVWVGGCELNSEYGAQWKCSGGGYYAGNEDYAVWMDAAPGYEKHWVRFN